MAPDKESDDADPDGRAFTGHPDHPPADADQPLHGNRELLDVGEQEDPSSTESGPQPQPPAHAKDEPDTGRSLPGYG